MSEDKKPAAAIAIRIAGVSDILEVVSNEGALALALGKPAADAISKVIAGAASIPEAWLRSKARSIEADQAAREKISASMADRAASLAPQDDALMDRATVRWIGQALREQENLEAVGSQTAERLLKEPSASSDFISDDFLNRFTDAAGKASSDQMRDLFSSVLAGEIRQPGRFSLAALHLFSIMDQRLARLIERYSSLTWSNTMLLTLGSTSTGIKLQEIRTLESFGLIATGLTVPVKLKNARTSFHIPDRFILAEFESQDDVRTSVALLTELGKEVFGLVARKSTDADLVGFLEDLKKLPKIRSLAHVGASGAELDQQQPAGPIIAYWTKPAT